MAHSMITTSRPQYTAEQIYAHADDLPGFTEPGDVFHILEDMPMRETRWQPVLSATIVTRLDGELHVLTGKRIAEGNTTHVNVASTPTMRVPPQEAGLLVVDHVPFCLAGNINPSHPFVSESLYPSVAALPDNSDVLASKVSNILALKLGLSSALESSQKPVGRTSLARCIVGFSYLDDAPSGAPLYEPLIMLGAIVGLDQETAEQIPGTTSSYSHLGWAALDRYVHGVASKTLLDVIPKARPEDELEVCVKGLCNATSSTIVSNLDEIQYHLTEDGTLPPF
jgi:hypothetical protein